MLSLGALSFHFGLAFGLAFGGALLGGSGTLGLSLHGIAHSLWATVACALFAQALVGSFQLVLFGGSGYALGLVILGREHGFGRWRVNHFVRGSLVVSRVVSLVREFLRALRGLAVLLIEHGGVGLVLALGLRGFALAQSVLDGVDFGQSERLFGLHGSALFFSTEDAVVCGRLAAHACECLFRSLLLALLF